MAVPSTIADLDAVASNNSPAGTESIGTSLDDYLRAHAAIIKQVSNAKQDSLGVTPTAAGLALLDDVDAAAQRTTLGLGTAATQASTAFATAGAITTSGLTQATGKLIGRSTASTGAPEEITVGTGLSLSAGTLSVSSTGLTLGTAQATTSGTDKEFTSIPSWVKRITVILQGVNTSGTNFLLVQLGTGAGPTYTTSGYLGASNGNNSVVNQTTGLPVVGLPASANVCHGTIVITNISGNAWVSSAKIAMSNTAAEGGGSGSITLGAALTALRLTTVGRTDTFVAGSVNILYE